MSRPLSLQSDDHDDVEVERDGDGNGDDDDDDGDDGDDDDAHQAIKEHVIRVVLAKAGKRGLPQDAKELRVK